MIAPIPLNENLRLEALHAYDILDTVPENNFDALVVQIASELNAPIAVIGFIDQTRHWFKAKFGTEIGVNKREWATCAHTIYQAKPLIAPDVRLEPRFADMPPLQQVGIKAYAGAPIINADGCAVGSVCVFDTQVRPFTDLQIQKLEQFAQQVLTMLETRIRTEESEGIEIASHGLAISQPSPSLENKILQEIRLQPARTIPNARLENLSHNRVRLHFYGNKPSHLHWQIWSMNPLETAPRPIQTFDSPSTDFIVPNQAKIIMVSLEPKQTATHPTQVLAVLPLNPQSN